MQNVLIQNKMFGYHQMIWYEVHSCFYYNNQDEIINRWMDISEMPIYIKTGAIISKQPFSKHKLLGTASNASYDHIYPSPNINNYYNLHTVLYEDDGISYDYLNGTNVLTYFNSIRIYNVFTATKVSCNGVNIEYNPLYYGFEHDDGYYYDGKTMSLVVNCPNVKSNFDAMNIQINFNSNWKNDLILTNGMKGKINRAILCKQSLDEANDNYGTDRVNLSNPAGCSTYFRQKNN